MVALLELPEHARREDINEQQGGTEGLQPDVEPARQARALPGPLGEGGGGHPLGAGPGGEPARQEDEARDSRRQTAQQRQAAGGMAVAAS